MSEELGWVRLNRNIIDSQIFQNEKLLKVYIWCLLKASHKEHEHLVGMTLVNVKKGQFVYGRLSASEKLNLNDRTFYKYMKLLEQLGVISIKTNNRFSIATVIDYESITQNGRGSKQYGLGYHTGLQDKEKEIMDAIKDKVEEVIREKELREE